MLNSCIYKVNVMHSRLRPKKHCFQHSLFMFLLDLDQLQSLDARCKLLGVNRNALYSFHDEDHFAKNLVAAKEKLIDFLREKNIDTQVGKVLLLTNLRFLGFVFNPISIYFVLDQKSNPLCAVAEVGNTFLERKPYLLPMTLDKNGSMQFTLKTVKNFYVSPYSKVDDKFEFRCTLPDESLEVGINTYAEQDSLSLVSKLSGARIELTDKNIFSCTLRYPFVTVGIIFLIHYHALQLWLKKIPHYRKEEKIELQTELCLKKELSQ